MSGLDPPHDTPAARGDTGVGLFVLSVAVNSSLSPLKSASAPAISGVPVGVQCAGGTGVGTCGARWFGSHKRMRSVNVLEHEVPTEPVTICCRYRGPFHGSWFDKYTHTQTTPLDAHLRSVLVRHVELSHDLYDGSPSSPPQIVYSGMELVDVKVVAHVRECPTEVFRPRGLARARWAPEMPSD